MISKTKNLIFIHIYKTGGSSIKQVMNRYADRELKLEVSKTIGGHATAARARRFLEKIEPGFFDKCTKFCVVRNPYDWQVSLYEHVKKHTGHPDYEAVKGMEYKDYLKWLTETGSKRKEGDGGVMYNSISDFIRDEDGNIIVDEIIRYEGGLNVNFRKFCKNIGIEELNLPHNKRTGRKGYKEHYDDESRKLMNDLYGEDIKHFNYEF